jgi:hypothetical protein
MIKTSSLVFLISALSLTACETGSGGACPPKSDTQVIADTISDILVPKIRVGCQ